MDGSVADANTTVQNPRERAGYLSLLTFSWINNVLKLGSKIPLEEKHLHPTETASEAERLVDALENEWMAEERKCEARRTKPCLWRVLIRIIPSRDIIIMGVLRILWSITVNIFPWFLWMFLKSIVTPSENSYASTLPFVLCLLAASIVRTLLVNQGLIRAVHSGGAKGAVAPARKTKCFFSNIVSDFAGLFLVAILVRNLTKNEFAPADKKS